LIIDVNAYIGHWPFRQLRHNTADGLLRLMDENGIDKAMVSSINAIFYRNCHDGNEELANSTKAHCDRFITFATLSPKYAEWKDDLKQCYEDYGMAGVRMLPQYHDYKLFEGEGLEMVNFATERKMAISIPIRMEDRRQRHWLDKVDDLQLSDIESAMRACPEARFIILNGRGFESLAKNDGIQKSNFLIEISRLGVVLQDEIPKLIELLGASKLAFGTGIPFNYPNPSLLKMQILDVPEKIKEKLFWQNALYMLNAD
jgi:predicted TIM-barrel fold metal-dependent hydrolase